MTEYGRFLSFLIHSFRRGMRIKQRKLNSTGVIGYFNFDTYFYAFLRRVTHIIEAESLNLLT